MAELSPAAQAIWHAYETANCDPYFIDPRQAGVAAALLAVADQVVPEDFDYWDGRAGDYASGCETGQNERNAHVRRELFAIATALVDPNLTSEGD
jgi:hypothetical protein